MGTVDEMSDDAKADAVVDVRVELAERAAELAAAAAEQGVSLVGPDGVLASLTKTFLEAGLEAEMSNHLGYDKHDVAGLRCFSVNATFWV